MKRAVVVGGGAWGTALSVVLARAGTQVKLLVRRPDLASWITYNRENSRYLPGVWIPPDIEVTAEPNLAFDQVDGAVIAVPSRYLEMTLSGLPPAPAYLSAVKGLFFRGNQVVRMSQVIAAITGNPKVAAISGPNHAEEVGRLLPATSVVAGETQLATSFQHALHSHNFRVYTSNDLIGVESGGAMKNVIALAAGMADGLHLGDNTKASVLTRGVAEMARLGVYLGAQEATFFGLSGVGDLIATATSQHSRNRAAGERIARGESAASLEASRLTVEGFGTTRALYSLALNTGIPLPITEAVYQIITGNWSPEQGVTALMTREPKAERAN